MGIGGITPAQKLKMARESYCGVPLRTEDYRLIRKNPRSGQSEMWNSLNKQRYLALCQRYCPALQLSDLHPCRPCIRAQAVLGDGTLAHDSLIPETRHTIHVCNAHCRPRHRLCRTPAKLLTASLLGSSCKQCIRENA